MKSLVRAVSLVSVLAAAAAHGQNCAPPAPGTLEQGHHNLKPGQLQMGSTIAERLIKAKVDPIFPLDAKVSPKTGYIKLEVTIGTDGTATEVTPACGPKALKDAAVKAVKQWTFNRYLVGGQPREVVTNVYLPYDLSATDH